MSQFWSDFYFNGFPYQLWAFLYFIRDSCTVQSYIEYKIVCFRDLICFWIYIKTLLCSFVSILHLSITSCLISSQPPYGHHSVLHWLCFSFILFLFMYSLFPLSVVLASFLLCPYIVLFFVFVFVSFTFVLFHLPFVFFSILLLCFLSSFSVFLYILTI